MNYEFRFSKDKKEYLVVVTSKKIKNVIFRYLDNTFFVSAPFKTPKQTIIKYLNKHYERLLSKQQSPLNPLLNGQLYLLGELITLNEGYLTKKNFLIDNQLYYLDEKDLEKKLKTIALNHFTSRVRYFEELMKIKKPYNIKVRKMKTRYASNSQKTHSLTFQLALIHFAEKLSDAIIIHELAHDTHFHHQNSFYNKVLKFCPNYYELIEMIKKGQFSDN
ncbi:MAG: YgjP-like metallopeptidase domain-containing protein [Bacilli bacterium]|jgi:predicted metal-dependent hydrolase|nr:DUF45 domain-containing protein [Bacilli bacterium]NLN80719.1 M48 family metallopeptidase [Erysipelotrichia bacterium]